MLARHGISKWNAGVGPGGELPPGSSVSQGKPMGKPSTSAVSSQPQPRPGVVRNDTGMGLGYAIWALAWEVVGCIRTGCPWLS